MASWSKTTKHLPSSINNGNKYEIKDRVTREQLNAITENSFYASEKVDTILEDVQRVAETSKSQIQSLSNSAKAAILDVTEQGVEEILDETSQSKTELNSIINSGKTVIEEGKKDIQTLTNNSKIELSDIVDDAETLVQRANNSISNVVNTANEALFRVEQVLDNKGYSGSNPNLLINGDFRVNQKNQELYTATLSWGNYYPICDGWMMQGDTGLNFNAETRTFTGAGWIIQPLTKFEDMLGKTFTCTINMNVISTGNTTSSRNIALRRIYSDGTTEILGNENFVFATTIGNQIISKTFTISLDTDKVTTAIQLIIYQQAGASTQFDYIKLESGSIATPYYPRPYEEELAMSQVVDSGVVSTSSNPNLLINGDFRVNQRAFTSMTALPNKATYTVDRWSISASVGNTLTTCTLNIDGTITFVNNGENTSFFTQKIDPVLNNMWGKTYTMSCQFSDGTVLAKTFTFPIEFSDNFPNGFDMGKSGKHNGIKLRAFMYPNVLFGFTVDIESGANGTIKWCKLEQGNTATLFKQRAYNEEYESCLYYFRRIKSIGQGVGVVCPTFAYSSTEVSANIQGRMRTSPRVDEHGIEYRSASVGTQSVQDGNITLNTMSTQNIQLKVVVSGANYGESGLLRLPSSGSYIDLDAEY